MKKYKVWEDHVTRYFFEVEAENLEQAIDICMNKMDMNDSYDDEFMGVNERNGEEIDQKQNSKD